MPKIPSSSVTFAFSEKQQAWTTRYSFVPTCYANCGDVMLSSSDNSGVWKHDANPVRNSFYGVLHPCSLDVVFNDYPSEVKAFKALSIETNKDVWIGKFFTNQEHEDENNQKSHDLLATLKDKEGMKYVELPRSSTNSTANIYPFYSIEVDTDTINEASDNQEPTWAFEVFLPISNDGRNPSFPVGAELLAVVSNDLISFKEFIDLNYTSLSSIPFLGGTDKSVRIVSVDNDVAVIRSSRPPGLTGTFNTFIEAFIGFIGLSQLYLKSPSSVNGDQMRGPYLKARLSCPDASGPVEINALNIDYEFSSSAARLTQNT